MKTLCRFCGTVTGEYGGNPNDVRDVRCSAHEQEHGKFQDMEYEYKQKIRGSDDDFMVFMKKSEFKKSNFDKELLTKIENKYGV